MTIKEELNREISRFMLDRSVNRPLIAFLHPNHPFWKMYTEEELCHGLGCDEVRETRKLKVS